MARAGTHENVVLIVEPDGKQRNEIIVHFERFNLQALVCGTAEEALEMDVDSERLAVLITDLHLSKLSGIDLMRRVRELNDAVQMIVYTAEGDYQLAKEALSLGACAFLEKEDGLDELLKQVRRAFHLRASQNLRIMYESRFEDIAQMVAGVAHELNTPLGVARSACSMVRDSLKELVEDQPEGEELDELYEDMQGACDLMIRNFDRSRQLIDSFRKLSSSQLGEEKVSCQLSELVQETLDNMEEPLKRTAIDARLVIDEKCDYTWEGYPDHFQQVVTALLENVVRYAYPENQGGDLLLRITRPGGGRVFNLEITDQGVGIDDKILPRLFSPFVTTGRMHGAVGLGLAIVRNVVTELFGGRIACRSKIGQGTTFNLELPVIAGDREAFDDPWGNSQSVGAPRQAA